MSLTATLGTDVPGGNVQNEQKFFRAYGTIAASGNYATNGDTLTFAGVVPVPNTTPIQVWLQGSGAYDYVYNKTTKKVKVNQLTTTLGGGLTPYSPGGGDIKGSTALAGTEANADQASAPVNATLIGAEQTFTAMAGTKTVAASPDVARNVMVVIHNDSGGALNLFEGATTFHVVGTFRGAAQTEDIVLTSTGANKAVANTKYRAIAGVKPFDKVTAITYDNAADGGLKCSIAPGSKLGLPELLGTAAEADVKKVTVKAADYDFTGKVDGTNNTVNVGTLADGDDVAVIYNAVNEGVPSPTKTELAAGAYPSAITNDVITFEAVFPKA